MKRSLMLLLFIFCFSAQAFCWLRDANIAASRDSVGFGSGASGSVFAEKIVDSSTSIGFSLANRIFVTDRIRNFFDISYNKQVAGDNDGNYACSLYGGAILTEKNDSSYAGDPKWMGAIIPEFGAAFRWKFNKYITGRLDMLWFIEPVNYEIAFAPTNDFELSIGLGLKYVVGLKYLF
jgi:hypothetical protein